MKKFVPRLWMNVSVTQIIRTFFFFSLFFWYFKTDVLFGGKKKAIIM